MSLDWRPPRLETDRLVLRPVTSDDAPAVFRYCANPNVTRFTLFETHQSVADSLWFVEEYARSRYASREPDPFGLVVIAVVSAALSYFLSVWVWRWMTARKWARRRARRTLPPVAVS